MSPEFAQLYDDCARQWDDLRRVRGSVPSLSLVVAPAS